MKRGPVLVIVGLVVALAAVFAYRYWSNQSSASGPAEKLVHGSDAAELWPTRHAWTWRISPVATKQRVRVGIRTIESDIPAGAKSPFPTTGTPTRPLPERFSNWEILDGDRLDGFITSQFIDLAEIGLGEVTANKPLRLLVRLRVGQTTMAVSGTESILDGETLAAVADETLEWSRDELHVLTVYTRTKDKMFANRIILQQGNEK